MKKYVKSIIVAGAAVALAASSYGQGTVYLNNGQNTGVLNGNGGVAFTGDNSGTVFSSLVTSNGLVFTTDTSEQAGNLGGPTGSALIGENFSFAIYGSLTSGGTFSLLDSVTGSAINNGSGTNPNWGELADPSGASYGVGSGTPTVVYLEVYAWEGSTYSDYADALSAGDYVAFSGVFENPSGSGVGSPQTMYGMPDINLAVVPEPTTLAIAALGGLSLLGLRRKKA